MSESGNQPGRHVSGPKSLRAGQIAEFVVVSAAGAFYMYYRRPVPATALVLVPICVVVSSLPLWSKHYRGQPKRYASLERCFGFGLLFVSSLLGGRRTGGIQ